MIALGERSRRFNELRRLVEGISQQMLTRTLKILERDRPVTRKRLPTVPPQVEYTLTPRARRLGGGRASGGLGLRTPARDRGEPGPVRQRGR